jgi:endonuclease G
MKRILTMSHIRSRFLTVTIAALLVIFAATGFVSSTPSHHTSTPRAVYQESVSLHLTLGNPSDATTNAGNKDNFLLVKPQFVLSYNNTKGEPNWVSWHLQKSDIGTVPRQTFHPEDGLPSGFKVVLPTDYTGSGFDRGHVCNSKDRTRTVADNQATFSMANMLPQTPALNQHVWLKLEEYERTLANQGNEVYIIAGGIGSRRVIGHANRVTVPTDCWKILVVLPQGNNDLSRINADTRVIAVIMPNKTGITNDPWQKYIKTVRDVEEATGYNFLSEVPQGIQDAIETRRDPGRAAPTRRPQRRGRRTP